MAKKRETKPVDWLILQIDKELERFGQERRGLSLREKVLRLSGIYENFKNLGVSTVFEHGLESQGARERIRLYLIECAGEVVSGIELEVVSGISEYARRVRELRVESGYHIASGASPDPEAGIDLKPDEYLLVSEEPDSDAARRWHTANRIRRGGGGSQKRLLEYLLENVGKILTTEELAYVAKDATEYARRVRELRTEQGYAIATRFTGRPDLNVGQYVLQSGQRVAEPHDRRIPDNIQKIVYERDANTCRVCGWKRERWTTDDPRILELHHLEHHEEGGANKPYNLIVICSKCHDEVHAEKHVKEIEKIRNELWRMYSRPQKDAK